MDQVIVKVQTPLESNALVPRALVYTRDRTTIYTQVPVTLELLGAMGGKVKRFFYAHLEGDTVSLGRCAPWQEW